ncbi:hypothetical protein [Opacimonas viscosa]|uniref:Uncharacterized protein n=1 Tax=Opacimonas viscosa TaxID=2961944 RepID=A0AA42BM37_9ALTE|nr:hypothetical protein [Opacimonas viscosa]MCP3429548.1 hypothetical protein [Opacimonas viscosa]
MNNVEAKPHVHDDRDEFFLVLKATLEIDVENETFAWVNANHSLCQ